MKASNNENVSVQLKQTDRYLLYRVVGNYQRPLRFDLINLDGKKMRSIDLLFGNEFVIPIRGLSEGEYLYALNGTKGLLQSGVIHL
jgi:hypothetical protein